jgi:hypothetical protein
LAFYSVAVGHDGALAVKLAWAYVVLRILHSLIQCTVNRVMLRFPVFALASLVLIAWTVIEVSAAL